MGKLGFRALMIISSSCADMKTKATITLWEYEEEEEALLSLDCLESSGFGAVNLTAAESACLACRRFRLVN